MTHEEPRPVTYIVPCAAIKADRPMPARDLYTSPHFRHVLATAETLAAQDREGGRSARVLIMSARHGLLTLDQVVAPYDTTIGDPESITPAELARQAETMHGIAWRDEVYALLPRAYFARLSAALDLIDVYPQDVFEACTGIGYQRATCAAATRVPAA
ncbi:DUF6884 domain-containing protein [Amycolatopsis thermophila]|uniref:DUF6884 domain-containing protein n=1 Tax=Amycolatopsis thermophila TaxID=206084 RepID=A0ABU0EMV1_9PSEU|nr:DUF6884 domain-containing protein [Amycolatopsis thermophila]MDQ0376621.1 hypothetical protein [Amycolatopsis thermophila]